MITIHRFQILLLIPALACGLASCVVDDTNAPATASEVAGSPAGEEVPATGPVPQKVIDDCLAALRKQIPDREMKVISARRGETSFLVDVEVAGVPQPWRCYHDGSTCTGTEYQGEG